MGVLKAVTETYVERGATLGHMAPDRERIEESLLSLVNVCTRHTQPRQSIWSRRSFAARLWRGRTSSLIQPKSKELRGWC